MDTDQTAQEQTAQEQYDLDLLCLSKRHINILVDDKSIEPLLWLALNIRTDIRTDMNNHNV